LIQLAEERHRVLGAGHFGSDALETLEYSSRRMADRPIFGTLGVATRHGPGEPAFGGRHGRYVEEVTVLPRPHLEVAFATGRLDEEVDRIPRISKQEPIRPPSLRPRQPIDHRDDLRWMGGRRYAERRPKALLALDHCRKRIEVNDIRLERTLPVVRGREDLHVGVIGSIAQRRKRTTHGLQFGKVRAGDRDLAVPESGAQRLESTDEGVQRLAIECGRQELPEPTRLCRSRNRRTALGGTRRAHRTAA
jgi:hypothetical protein